MPDLISNNPRLLAPIILISVGWFIGIVLLFRRGIQLAKISEAFRCRLCQKRRDQERENDSSERVSKRPGSDKEFKGQSEQVRKEINDMIFDTYKEAVDDKGFMDLVAASQLLEKAGAPYCEGLYGLCDWHWDKEHGVCGTCGVCGGEV